MSLKSLSTDGINDIVSIFVLWFDVRTVIAYGTSVLQNSSRIGIASEDEWNHWGGTGSKPFASVSNVKTLVSKKNWNAHNHGISTVLSTDEILNNFTREGFSAPSSKDLSFWRTAQLMLRVVEVFLPFKELVIFHIEYFRINYVVIYLI